MAATWSSFDTLVEIGVGRRAQAGAAQRVDVDLRTGGRTSRYPNAPRKPNKPGVNEPAVGLLVTVMRAVAYYKLTRW